MTGSGEEGGKIKWNSTENDTKALSRGQNELMGR